MITPQWAGQIYRNTLNGDVWRANSLTPGDWTKIAGTAVAGSNVDGVGNPTGVVTPLYVGQYYRDTATGNIWKSTGTTNADWMLQVQDMEIRWNPNNLKLGELLGYINYSDLVGLDDFIFLGTSSQEGFYSESSIPVTFSAPNLQTIGLSFGQLYFSYCGITSISCPALTTLYGATFNYCADLANAIFTSLATIPGAFIITGCGFLTIPNSAFPSLVSAASIVITSNPNLTSISLPSLVTSGVDFSSNASLNSISIPNYLPTNGALQKASGCALPVGQIDGFLARSVANAAYVTGTILINGGTNAAPTTGPGSSHDILVARGVTITHN